MERVIDKYTTSEKILSDEDGIEEKKITLDVNSYAMLEAINALTDAINKLRMRI